MGWFLQSVACAVDGLDFAGAFQLPEPFPEKGNVIVHVSRLDLGIAAPYFEDKLFP